MYIGFDGKRIMQNFTGLGNYSRYIVNILVQYYPEHTYAIYAAKYPTEDIRNILNAHLILKQPIKKKFSSWWRTFSIVEDLKKDHIDLYHGLSNEIPVGLAKKGIRSVVTIHDLIFLRYPSYYKAVDRYIYTLKMRYACNNVRRIIAISEQTKRDIISFLNIPEEKIDVVYQGCHPIFKEKATPEQQAAVRDLYQLPASFILNVGTIESRKNLMLIIRALKKLDENINLVVIGKQTPYAKMARRFISDHKLTKRVFFLNNVPLAHLPVLYQMASIFVYPSEFEGFGIPIIEALHSGVPVIAATGSCLEEAGGAGSLYVHPKDDNQLAEHIQQVMANPTLKHEMIAIGYDYVKRFADDKIASDLIRVYQNALQNR